jgi:dihydropteroate synthase
MAPPFRLMGILNVTPDSFSDGGLFLDPQVAIAHGVELVEQGADIIDVGGESTRPGAEPVTLEQELYRVIPVVEGLAERLPGVQISIDTSKREVAQRALAAGANLVNDVSAFRGDPRMATVVAESGVDCCLMHMQGLPRTMQKDPHYENVVQEVGAFLEERIAFAMAEGVSEDRIMIDPGIGFGKTAIHNLELLRHLQELSALGRPIVIGTSRKSFIGTILAATRREHQPVASEDRLTGTLATCVLALERRTGS